LDFSKADTIDRYNDDVLSTITIIHIKATKQLQFKFHWYYKRLDAWYDYAQHEILTLITITT